MKRDEIMALSGRELDAAVAEHVMGYRRRIVPKDVDGKHGGTEVLVPASVHHDSFCYPPKGPIPFTFFVPHYSTDIAAAWQVVEHDLWFDAYMIARYGLDYGLWRVPVGNGRLGRTPVLEAPTLPLLICRAALLAVMGESDNTDVRAAKNGGGAE